MITPLGASLLHTPELVGGKIIGLDKNCALEMVQAGGVVTDYDKLIDRQLERAAVTCTAGFSKIFTEASKVIFLSVKEGFALNIANITKRFALYSGIDGAEAYKWKSIIDDAVVYVNSIVTKGNLSEDDELRLENLCAVYAFKLYSLCNDDSISSFSAGDLKISSSADGESRAEKLWREYADKSQDLIGREKFLLGVI